MKNKKIKCELTIRQMYVIRNLLEKYKKRIKREFLGNDSKVGEYIQSKMLEELDSNDWKILNKEWKELKKKWLLKKKPPVKKEEKTESIPRIRVWHAEED